MNLLDRIRGLISRNQATAQPAKAKAGPTYERIIITKNGGTHTVSFGVTSYGKGHVPANGHMPMTVVEYDGGAQQESDRAHDKPC